MYLLTNERLLTIFWSGAKMKTQNHQNHQNLSVQKKKEAPRCCYNGSFQENRQPLTVLSEDSLEVTCRFYGIRACTGGNYPNFKAPPVLASMIISLRGFRPGLGKISQGGQKLLRNDTSSCTIHPTDDSQEDICLANIECFIFILVGGFFWEIRSSMWMTLCPISLL